MGTFSLSHILVVAVLAVLLFGRGKVAELMGDFGKGIRSFRKSMAEDDAPAAAARVANGAKAQSKLAAAAPSRDG